MTEYIGQIGDPSDYDQLSKRLNLFWTGFVVYIVSYTVTMSGHVHFKYWQALQLVGLIFILLASIRLIRVRIENNYLRTIFILYFLWLMGVVVRGYQLNYSFIKMMLLDAWGGMFLYFVPLVLLFPRDLSYLRKVFNVIGILSIFYIILCLLYYEVLMFPYGDDVRSKSVAQYFSQNLAIPSGFILLTYLYHKDSRKFLAIAALLIALLVAVIRARRGLTFMSGTMILSLYFIYSYVNRKRLERLLFSTMFFGLVIIVGMFIYSKNSGGLFNLMTQRLHEDTRTGVEIYFYNDMGTMDMIVGRGIYGRYFAPNLDQGEYFQTYYRTALETDYLLIILKGGIVSLVLLLLILIPAIFLGLFNSRNLLTKASGFWILYFVINLYPVTVTTFTMMYILVWISVGICYSPQIRSMTDDEIKTAIFGKPASLAE